MIISKILTASIKQHNLEMIGEESSRQEKPRFGSRSGLTIPPNMVWDTIYRMTQLECSSTTPPKLFWTQMDTISTIWREDQVIVRMSAKSIPLLSIRRNFRRKLLFFNISGVISRVMISQKLFWRRTTLRLRK